MEKEEKEITTCTLTVEFMVFTSDVDTAVSEAERLLPDFLDGTDFASFSVIGAVQNKDE